MQRIALTLLFLLALAIVMPAHADDLTRMIQEDLVALGYDPGNMDGEADLDTVVAISKFQAEHDLEVTGEATPQLAGILKAEREKRATGAPSQANADAAKTRERTPQELAAAQQACLQEKVQARREAQKKKRGLSSLLRAASRTAGMTGNHEIRAISSDIYNANATAGDLASAAEDLGLTESDIEACRNPPM